MQQLVLVEYRYALLNILTDTIKYFWFWLSYLTGTQSKLKLVFSPFILFMVAAGALYLSSCCPHCYGICYFLAWECWPCWSITTVRIKTLHIYCCLSKGKIGGSIQARVLSLNRSNATYGYGSIVISSNIPSRCNSWSLF